jgi:hypothetical protein
MPRKRSSPVTTSQGVGRQEADPSPEPLEIVQPFKHLDFGPIKLILDVWPLELYI